ASATGPRHSISLDGEWQVRHDPKGEGLAHDWAKGGPADGWSKMAVPSCLQEWEALGGVWRLRVQDLAGGNAGRLQRWSLSARCDAPQSAASFESTDGVLEIPDGDARGVESSIPIFGGGPIAELTCRALVDHPKVEDLVVTLVHPDGSTSVIANRDGSLAGGTEKSFPVAAFAGKALGRPTGAFWARRAFTLPDAPASDWRLRLRFERVLGPCRAWLNGVDLGEHGGEERDVDTGRPCIDDAPFEFDATRAARAGENVLVVRLETPPMSWHASTPLARRVGGLVGSVSLVIVPAVAIVDASVELAPAKGPGAIDVVVELRADTHDPRAMALFGIAVEVLDPEGRSVAQATAPASILPGIPKTLVQLTLADPKPWDLSSPVLYRLVARLVPKDAGASAAPLDEVSVDFGFRTFEIRGARAFLNGRPLVLKAAVDSGYEPFTLVRPTSTFPADAKLQLLKNAGFNALVVPDRLPPRALVDAANRLGVLLVEPACTPHLRPDNVPLETSFIESRKKRAAADAERVGERVRRDRNDPSVVWWTVSDGDDALARRARELDADAIVSIDATTRRAGNAYFPPRSTAAVPYLRPDFHLDAPIDSDDLLRVRDLGDRDDFCFVTASAGAEICDAEKLLAGVGGQRWRAEAHALEPRLAALNAAFGRYGLKAFADAPRNLIEASQVLHAVATGRLIEALRSNPRVGAFAIRSFGDSPDAPADGFGVDLFGRPKRGLAAASLANAPRRVIALPRVRAGALQDETEVWLAPVADEGPPIDLKLVEVKRPDGLHGERTLLTDPDFKDHRVAPIAFMGGAGKYLVTPAWVGLTQPWMEEVILLGVDPGKKLFDDGAAPIARPAPHVAVVGAVGDLWTQEERFLAVADALEVARQGGTTILLDAFERPRASVPDDRSPLVVLDLVGAPNLDVRACGRAMHAIAADPAFGDLAPRGLVGDPLNEVAPRDTLSGLPEGKGERVGASIDERGDVVGVDLVRLPLGKGTVVLTTFRIGQCLAKDVVARRIANNLVARAVAAGGPALPPDLKAGDREALRARFRAAAAKRAAAVR
ncbi:MAG TPA: hypothetical protein VKE69_08100, partial [Planctomycetota bacterium]|nr:hypothetical protein [Planctomycetota bacterium]